MYVHCTVLGLLLLALYCKTKLSSKNGGLGAGIIGAFKTKTGAQKPEIIRVSCRIRVYDIIADDIVLATVLFMCVILFFIWIRT
jgi:hypothetical protein